MAAIDESSSPSSLDSEDEAVIAAAATVVFLADQLAATRVKIIGHL